MVLSESSAVPVLVLALKSTVDTGTIFEKYRGIGTGARYLYFLMIQLNCVRMFVERWF